MIREHFITLADPDAWQQHLPVQRSVFGSLGYARICEAHRNVSPRLYVLASDDAAISYPVLLRPLANLPFSVEPVAKWDSLSADYTGPMTSGNDPDLAAAFAVRRNARFESEGIVAEFAHLHPWSDARTVLQNGCEYNRDIVWVDTSLSPDELWSDVKPQCRQKIKQAERQGVRIIAAFSDEHIQQYHHIYSHTMQRNDARPGYFFSCDFFRAFRQELPENSRFMLAEYHDQIIAGTLCLYDDTDAFYFLTGMDARFQHLRPTNLLVWELIRWVHEAGKKRLTLGAGNCIDDGLFRFKCSFSPNRQPFHIYKYVHRPQDYVRLERRFREWTGLSTERIGYFPVYRYEPPPSAANTNGTSGVDAALTGRVPCSQKETSWTSNHEVFGTWPHFDQDEIEAAAAVLRSGRVSYWTGDQGRLFEREFAAFNDGRYAVAVANGTVALELALRALEIGPGDEVITTGRTFIASASAVVAAGARPVFADVDRDSQNLTAETIRAALTPTTRAIIAVHLAGWPCEMDEILILAKHHGLKVIEDCAQAHGATYRGRPLARLAISPRSRSARTRT